MLRSWAVDGGGEIPFAPRTHELYQQQRVSKLAADVTWANWFETIGRAWKGNLRQVLWEWGL